ncbi:VOC family protein [Tritonibacter horizontis]|uniref:Glyoxalase-like domain protein n=1 Tax=Tritonibacter horizontis TaxID=1768241 RepID=A0A132BSC0_9RHOB|nr:VOC family protein [Tritonibacter horizontis]KUP90650.1 glyoxalase-like domain protein [Tritonibacter horizontis]
MSIFHLAYNVDDLEAARKFYGEILGCRVARSSDSWIDFDFFGHQISLHLGTPFVTAKTGRVGEHLVPMPHLGVILPQDDWATLAERFHEAGVEFEIPPTTRFKGEPGEQSTMFFYDPAGNPIEIKGFSDMSGVFAT